MPMTPRSAKVTISNPSMKPNKESTVVIRMIPARMRKCEFLDILSSLEVGRYKIYFLQ